jgi:hypothetical protein
MLRTGAGRLAASEALPTSVRAVLGYYGDAGVFDWGSLRLKSRVDDVTDAMIEDAFAEIEERLAAEFDREDVSFAYDTKLVLPAQLTLGYQYRHRDESEHDRVDALTRLAIEALVDGDMRDAINDDEFGDFEVDFPADPEDRRRIAELAQSTLQARVDAGFADFPGGVREAYEWAVDVSEAHQAADERFRGLMAAARGEVEGGADETEGATLDPAQARERIREEYKHAAFADPPELFSADELDLPYFKTQYDRVGVIYDGMLGMYASAGFPVEDAFRKSIVLAIIGAQLWLDDVDDYAADMREGQLTPVTAEYLLADSDRVAYEATVDISGQYLDLAIERATAADSPLTGIATKYIYYSGSPEMLPDSG